MAGSRVSSHVGGVPSSASRAGPMAIQPAHGQEHGSPRGDPSSVQARTEPVVKRARIGGVPVQQYRDTSGESPGNRAGFRATQRQPINPAQMAMPSFGRQAQPGTAQTTGPGSLHHKTPVGRDQSSTASEGNLPPSPAGGTRGSGGAVTPSSTPPHRIGSDGSPDVSTSQDSSAPTFRPRTSHMPENVDAGWEPPHTGAQPRECGIIQVSEDAEDLSEASSAGSPSVFEIGERSVPRESAYDEGVRSHA